MPEYEYEFIISRRLDTPDYRWRFTNGDTGVLSEQGFRAVSAAIRGAITAADNPDSVKLRLARDLADAVAQRAAGAHPATYLLGRLNEPGISWDDDWNLTAWDYDPTDPQKHIVVTEADLATADDSIKTWTYSQVNPGAADGTHGFTFTGTDDEWAEHLADLPYQGIEPYNAKISTAPLTALGTEYPETTEGFIAAQTDADRMADMENHDPLDLTPADLRRIADILESNSDQPNFDFYSALAAMEAEDISGEDYTKEPIVYVKDGHPNIIVEPEGTVTQGDARFAQFAGVADACAYLERSGWKREMTENNHTTNSTELLHDQMET